MNRWFVGTTWAMLTVIGGLLVLLYNLYPDRGLESWEKRCVQSCVCVCVRVVGVALHCMHVFITQSSAVHKSCLELLQ